MTDRLKLDTSLTIKKKKKKKKKKRGVRKTKQKQRTKTYAALVIRSVTSWCETYTILFHLIFLALATKLHMHVQSGNGKLTLLSIILSVKRPQQNYTCMYIKELEVHVTFHNYSKASVTKLHMHVHPGNGKRTLLSILSVKPLQQNYTYVHPGNGKLT